MKVWWTLDTIKRGLATVGYQASLQSAPAALGKVSELRESFGIWTCGAIWTVYWHGVEAFQQNVHLSGEYWWIKV